MFIFALQRSNFPIKFEELCMLFVCLHVIILHCSILLHVTYYWMSRTYNLTCNMWDIVPVIFASELYSLWSVLCTCFVWMFVAFCFYSWLNVDFVTYISHLCSEELCICSVQCSWLESRCSLTSVCNNFCYFMWVCYSCVTKCTYKTNAFGFLSCLLHAACDVRLL
jgi:hypothetical protein